MGGFVTAQQGRNLMICKYCGKVFDGQRALSAHVGIKHKDESKTDWLKAPAKIGDDYVDISNEELIRRRELHNGRCDICGKTETANTRPDCKTVPNKLCADHDHRTLRFRGFICVQCNRNMGWLDRYTDEINTYKNGLDEYK